MGILSFGKTETRRNAREKERGMDEKDVDDAAHALASISPV